MPTQLPDEQRYLYLGEGGSWALEVPRTCPICHKDLHLESALRVHRLSDDSSEAVFECLHDACRRYFIAIYQGASGPLRGGTDISSLIPSVPIVPSLSLELEGISPKFRRVYEQTLIAKANGLDEIMGTGFRKALEVLTKDWFEHHLAEPEKSKVRKEGLADTIKRLPDGALGVPTQELADLVRLIGNDATHTVKKHTDLNPNDAEELINLIVGWMEQQLRAQHFARVHAAKRGKP